MYRRATAVLEDVHRKLLRETGMARRAYGKMIPDLVKTLGKVYVNPKKYGDKYPWTAGSDYIRSDNEYGPDVGPDGPIKWWDWFLIHTDADSMGRFREALKADGWKPSTYTADPKKFKNWPSRTDPWSGIKSPRGPREQWNKGSSHVRFYELKNWLMIFNWTGKADHPHPVEDPEGFRAAWGKGKK